MIFNFAEFITTNLLGGYRTKVFNEFQINMFALNYLNRGQLNQEEFNYILEQIESIKNPSIEEITED